MKRPAARDSLAGLLLLAATALVIAAAWLDLMALQQAAGTVALAGLVLLLPRVRRSRHLFVAVGAALSVWAVTTLPAWHTAVGNALDKMAFIAAFFVALACLRNAAAGSAAMVRCGLYLANQPPGRRYLALSSGGHLFALVINYGAISLFGSLVERSVQHEADERIRRIRRRRMLLAIQRGFVTTLCWSPLAFSMIISVAVVPGASWAGAAPYCLLGALLLFAVGWGLDTVFKPRGVAPPALRPNPPGAWKSLLPLLGLLMLMLVLVGGLQWLTGLRTVAIVMLVVPLLSLAWIAVQKAPPVHGERRPSLQRRLRDFSNVELPGYASELVLLMMASYIGTLASALLAPWVAAHPAAADVSALVLIGVLWMVPLLGQLGMNPILAVTMTAPLLPAGEQLGVSPNLVVLALTSGWALSGASSPFTATTMLIGRFGKVSAQRVGLLWNGPFTLVGGAALSLWLYLNILI